jgi:hypothetical protein
MVKIRRLFTSANLYNASLRLAGETSSTQFVYQYLSEQTFISLVRITAPNPTGAEPRCLPRKFFCERVAGCRLYFTSLLDVPSRAMH